MYGMYFVSPMLLCVGTPVDGDQWTFCTCTIESDIKPSMSVSVIATTYIQQITTYN